VTRRILPDLGLLSAALDQQGPWQGQGVDVTSTWYVERLRARVREIDWPAATDDVRRFLRSRQLGGLAHWGSDLFLQHIDELEVAFSR
jgi:hypothetical protein